MSRCPGFATDRERKHARELWLVMAEMEQPFSPLHAGAERRTCLPMWRLPMLADSHFHLGLTLKWEDDEDEDDEEEEEEKEREKEHEDEDGDEDGDEDEDDDDEEDDEEPWQAAACSSGGDPKNGRSPG